jgi:hypothetical protein
MRSTSSPLVPIISLVIAVAGVLLAIVGGTNATTAIGGLAVALGAGTIGVIAWRGATPASESSLTGQWWKFVLVGPCLVALVIIAAGLGVEAWELGVATVLAAFVSTAVGVVLGVSHLFSQRTGSIPT